MEKQLESLDRYAVFEKVGRNEALTLKELAVWTGFGYSEVRTWRGEWNFPLFHGRIFPEDFTLWRQGNLGLRSENGNGEHPVKRDADRFDVSLSSQ